MARCACAAALLIDQRAADVARRVMHVAEAAERPAVRALWLAPEQAAEARVEGGCW